WSWPVFALLSLFATLALKLVLGLVSAKLRKFTRATSSHWDDVGVDLIDGLKPFVAFVGFFFFSTRSLPQPKGVHSALLGVAVVAFIVQVALWGLHLVANW